MVSYKSSVCKSEVANQLRVSIAAAEELVDKCKFPKYLMWSTTLRRQTRHGPSPKCSTTENPKGPDNDRRRSLWLPFSGQRLNIVTLDLSIFSQVRLSKPDPARSHEGLGFAEAKIVG